MNVFRSRYRGVIHFYPADAGSPPEIEFSDGEGPEQVMNQIQDFAVPEIRKNIEPLGSYLRWEELDVEAGVVRRRRSRFHDRFEFELCPDELGIELVLPTDGDAADDALTAGEGQAACAPARSRPWVPLRPLAEPGAEHLAAIGWSVEEPKFWWRYLKTRYAPPTIEMTWSCASLPAEWAARVLASTKVLDCRFGADKQCLMNPTRDGLLVYRGFYPLPAGAGRPAHLSMRMQQPLAVVGPEDVLPDPGDGGRLELDQTVAATLEALDFRALIGGRPTRLVARADLDRRFEAEVLTAEDVLLPEMIPAGAIPGLPWALEVSRAPGADETPPASRRADAGRAGRRRWRLVPGPRAGTLARAESARLAGGGNPASGRWRDVAWEQDPPSLGFGLGSIDASESPRITHIENRRASVAWRIEAADEGGNMCLCVPHWVPVGCPEHVALPARGSDSDAGGFDYGAEVRAQLQGLEERFVIYQRSEVSPNRLFLGPRRWRFRDQQDGMIAGGEAFGEGAGCVRWRRDAGAGSEAATSWNGRHELTPTDWAGGSAPVLLLGQDKTNAAHWGGLYAPRAVPWDALEEVPSEPTPAADEILLVPRAPSLLEAAGSEAIWIDLWGFVCRYDARRLVFTRHHGEDGQPTAWIARTGLELFPRRSGYLLRSFSPIYAVRDPEPRIFSLRPTAPRPTLHLGHELDAGTGCRGPNRRRPGTGNSLVLEIGAETYLRHQVTAAGRLPESFEPGRIPGTRLRLERIGRQVVWLAVEQRRGEVGRRAGYLLSWDAAAGWLFRGFFAHPGATAELGLVRQGERQRRILLGGDGASRVSAFRLTLDRQGARWSQTAPEETLRRVTPEMIRAWENDHFAPERRPAPLQAYGIRILQQSAGDQPWIFELFDGSQAEAELPPGIRVWELHGEATEDLIDGARELGEDPEAEAAEIRPLQPEKRILRVDDDEDDF